MFTIFPDIYLGPVLNNPVATVTGTLQMLTLLTSLMSASCFFACVLHYKQ